VTHVLAMAAVEIRDPMAFIIPVEPDDPAIHLAISRRAQD